LVGGLSRQIVGTGTDVATGLNYVDFRYFGTATTNSNNIRLELNNGIVASPGDTWSTSIYAALVGGSTNGGQVTFQYGLYVNDINGGIITAPVPWIPVTLTGTLQRFFDYADVITNDPATGFVWPVFAFVYPPGSVVDFTVRLAGAQVEYGSNVTDLLLPPPGTPRVTDRVITPDSTVVSVIIGGQGGMTNWIDNPNAEGAVVGTPGTPPTNWSWSTTLGIATQVVATGNADPDRGLPYIDIRLSGTPTATGGIYLRLATTTSIPGLSGDGWSQSVHAALVGGSTVNLLSVGQVVLYLTTAGTLVTNTGSTQFTPTATLQRFSISNRVTPVGATIRRVCPVLWFQLTIGNAIDLTLRIAAPQFESNPVVTPPILPPLGSPGVTTRALLAQPTTLVAAQARIDGIGGFTNWMTNPNGIGGVVGTSTLPTNWSAGNTAASWTVVGTGTVVTDDDAKTLNYVDIRFNATPTSSGNTLRLDLTTAIPTQPSAIWSMSMYVALVGGSLAAGNVAMGQILYAISATGVNLAGTGQINFTPTASLQRFFLANRTMPTAYPDTRYVWPVIAFGYTQGAAVDFTLRIAGIQLEAGSVCTPVAVPSAANFGPFTRGLLAMPTVANFAQINGVGTLRAAAAKITTAQGQIGGAGNVRATAVVRAGAQAEIDGEGFVSATGGGLQFARAVINGGEGNRLNARGTPGPQTPNTCVVSTDIPSPFGDNSLVFKHTAFNSTNATNCGALGNTTGPLNIPYTINVWVWLPAGWAGSELHFPVEGLAYPNLSYPFTPDQYADLTLTNQWQLVSYQLPTSPVGAGTFSMVCRPVDPTATSFYTSLWAAVPDTLAAAPTQTMRGLAEIDGEGFVVPAPLGRVPTSARIAGVGSFAATVFSTRAASAEIDGVGTPRANVTPLRPASAEIDGAGFITATPSAFATQAQARIAGVGSVAADGQPMRAAAARINGVGGVRATVSSRFVAASAEIDGQGGGKTNYIRNPRLEGAVVGVVGSGGLRPTFWVVGGDPMAWDVVSIGVEDGLSYVDIRWHGISTATANSYILPEGAIGPNQPQSFPGLTSTSSLYCRLVGGDLTNVNRVQLSQQDRASDQTYISGNAVLFTLPGGVTLGTQRFAVSWTSSATGAFMVPVIYAFFNAGSLAIDFTLRIGGLQQEWGALATQLILPPAGIFGPWMRGIDAGARLLLPAAGEIDGEGFVTTSPGRLLPAQARIAGLGSLQVDARPARAASAEIDGEGFVIPALTTRALITLEIDGEGFVLATATPLRPTQARIDGVGTVRAIGGAILLAAARLNGVGSCNILPTGAQLAQLEIDGQGSLRANAVPARGATAAVAGIGSVSATATVRVAGLAEIDGEGFITAPGMGLRPALGRIDGLGSFVALASARARASAEIDGEGFPTGDAQRVAQLRQALAEIDGVGTIRATAVAQMLGAALIAGLGQVRADGLAQHPSGSQVIPGEGFVLTVATAVVQAAALIAGTGGVTAVSRAALPAGAGIAGTGSLTADSVPRRAGVARITGDAGVAATAQLLLPAQARIAGQGSLTADTLGEDEGAARIDGLGALRADGLVQRPANARIDGLGTVRAAAAVPAQAAAEIDGAGSVRAAVQGATPAQARLAGVGSLRVDALVQRPASATIAGVGTLAAQAIRLGAIVPASARIDGVGAVAAAGGGLNLIAARIDGVGAVLATITANREAAARINGIGGVQAAALYLGQTPAAGLIAGRGGVFVAMPALRARVLRVAPIGAVGHIAASATVIATAAARIRGVGGVSLAAVESHPAAARIAGTGRVRMTAHLAFAARATLHGIGLLRAKVSAEIHAATARIAGTGSVRAATSGHFTVPAAARIDGTGALRATTTARRDAAALLAGEGDLDTHGRPAQFAEAAIVGTGRVAAHASVAARMAASRLNGVGSVRATGARVIPAGAVIFGRGYIDANGTHEVRDGAAIVGVGRVQANATQVHQTHPAAAVIHGTGSLRVTRARLHAVIAAVLTGIGRAVARGSIHAPADARVGGRGLVRADAVKAPRVAGAILTGHGGVHANAQVRHYVHASARITGSGHLAAAVSDVLQSVHASARIHGLGAVHADSDVHEAIHAAARIDGHGLLRQFPIPGWFHASARARIGGHGAVHAIAHVAHPARARIIGLGRVRAALHRLVLASAHIAGVGQVRDQVVVHTLVYAEARIDGAGRLRTDPHIPRERVAALGVYLPPTPRGAAIPPQTGGDVTLPPTRRSVTV
jgi:hypothetical protein